MIDRILLQLYFSQWLAARGNCSSYILGCWNCPRRLLTTMLSTMATWMDNTAVWYSYRVADATSSSYSSLSVFRWQKTSLWHDGSNYISVSRHIRRLMVKVWILATALCAACSKASLSNLGSKLAVDWQELTVLQRIMQPSIARDNWQMDQRCSLQIYHCFDQPHGAFAL